MNIARQGRATPRPRLVRSRNKDERIGPHFPNIELTRVLPPMLNYPPSIKRHLAHLVLIPRLVEDDHGDLIAALDVGPHGDATDFEQRLVRLVIAAELLSFLGEHGEAGRWVTNVDLTRSTLTFWRTFRDPHPPFERLRAFAQHWDGIRRELA